MSSYFQGENLNLKSRDFCALRPHLIPGSYHSELVHEERIHETEETGRHHKHEPNRAKASPIHNTHLHSSSMTSQPPIFCRHDLWAFISAKECH